MNYKIRFLDGLISPQTQFLQLKESEKISGFYWKLAAVLGVSAFFSLLSAAAGIGMEEVMRDYLRVSQERLESMKLFWAAGNVLSGLAAPLMIVLVYSGWLKLAFNEIPFGRLAVLNFYIAVLYVIEKIVLLPFHYFLGFSKLSSPFAFGIIGQVFTKHSFLLHLLNNFSLFFIAGTVIQYIGLRVLSSKSNNYILLILVLINLLSLIFISFLQSIA